MNNIILDALDYYFERRTDEKSEIRSTDEIIETMPVMMVNGIKKKYNVLGIINNDHFYWIWYLNIPKYKFIKSKQLISYAVNKEVCTLQDAYIKKILLTPVHDFKGDINVLTIILALALYLTKAHRFLLSDKMEVIGLYDIDS